MNEKLSENADKLLTNKLVEKDMKKDFLEAEYRGYADGIMKMKNSADLIIKEKEQRIAELEKELEAAEIVIKDLEQSNIMMEKQLVREEDIKLLNALNWAIGTQLWWVKETEDGDSMTCINSGDIQRLLDTYDKHFMEGK